MRRTTVYLDTETDLLLKREALRRKRPVAELIREALDGYARKSGARLPPGVGAFDKNPFFPGGVSGRSFRTEAKRPPVRQRIDGLQVHRVRWRPPSPGPS